MMRRQLHLRCHRSARHLTPWPTVACHSPIMVGVWVPVSCMTLRLKAASSVRRSTASSSLYGTAQDSTAQHRTAQHGLANKTIIQSTTCAPVAKTARQRQACGLHAGKDTMQDVQCAGQQEPVLCFCTCITRQHEVHDAAESPSVRHMCAHHSLSVA